MTDHRKHAGLAAFTTLLPMLSGCVGQLLPEPSPPPRTFDFGPLPSAPPPPLPLRFELDDVEAPSWLETLDIYYRRLDEQPGSLRAYARNQWIAPTTELFEQRLTHRLAQAAPAAGEVFALHVELLTFEHVYAAPDNAYVVARARVSYADVDGRLHRRELEQRRPAPASVDGATSLLPAVAEDLVDAVLAWVREAALVGTSR